VTDAPDYLFYWSVSHRGLFVLPAGCSSRSLSLLNSFICCVILGSSLLWTATRTPLSSSGPTAVPAAAAWRVPPPSTGFNGIHSTRSWPNSPRLLIHSPLVLFNIKEACSTPDDCDYTNQLSTNPYGWNAHANVLYLDQPRFVGYSFGSGKSGLFL